ncbi:MAG: hypothetical protein CMG00_08020, partial [Candidatus Marinimicrobia bacterium]|nr:hypothetical protein [Candidatus Neomarinimicrobiota bacterium]
MCLFGFMFSQVKLETRVYEFNINLTNGETEFDFDIEEITGHDLSYAVFEFVGIDDYTWFDYVDMVYQCDNIGYSSDVFTWEAPGLISNSESQLYLKDSNCTLRNTTSNTYFNRVLYLSITAEFPEEDTGYIEEGFDFCLASGNNLVAFPCKDPVSVNTALPDLAQSE